MDPLTSVMSVHHRRKLLQCVEQSMQVAEYFAEIFDASGSFQMEACVTVLSRVLQLDPEEAQKAWADSQRKGLAFWPAFQSLLEMSLRDNVSPTLVEGHRDVVVSLLGRSVTVPLVGDVTVEELLGSVRETTNIEGVLGLRDRRTWEAYPAERRLSSLGDSEMSLEITVYGSHKVIEVTHDERILGVSLNGGRLATASGDRTACVWDLSTGEKIASVQHRRAIYGVVLDGDRLATGSVDGTACVWEVSTSNKITQVMHEGAIYNVALDAQYERLGTASRDTTAAIWNAVTGQLLMKVYHDDIVHGIVLDCERDQFATSSRDSSCVLWNLTTGRQVALFPHAKTVLGVAVESRAHRLFSASSAGTVKVWNTETRQEVHELQHQDWVYAAAVQPHTKCLFTASDDNKVTMWSYDSGAKHMEIPLPSAAFAVSCEGDLVAAALKTGVAAVWEVSMQTLPATVRPTQ
mmetsp:Transcript_40541/g.91270  ORF Transcript_40541/g.91270 Transcript_40541/m.91270 type:complete len:463 (+) Transcript_40541:71-1459(+)